MIELIAGLCVGAVCILMYRKGVADGMRMAVGEPPTPIVQSVKEIVSKKEAEDENGMESQYQSFMNYQPKFTEERHAAK